MCITNSVSHNAWKRDQLGIVPLINSKVAKNMLGVASFSTCNTLEVWWFWLSLNKDTTKTFAVRNKPNVIHRSNSNQFICTRNATCNMQHRGNIVMVEQKTKETYNHQSKNNSNNGSTNTLTKAEYLYSDINSLLARHYYNIPYEAHRLRA